MRLLLDTHILVWALSDVPRLSSSVAEAIEDARNDVFVSAATAWEIAIKQSLGRITLPGNAEDWLPGAVEDLQAEWLAIDASHAYVPISGLRSSSFDVEACRSLSVRLDATHGGTSWKSKWRSTSQIDLVRQCWRGVARSRQPRTAEATTGERPRPPLWHSEAGATTAGSPIPGS